MSKGNKFDRESRRILGSAGEVTKTPEVEEFLESEVPREISPATLLVQDIINSVIEVGRPPYSDTLFVDSGFSFQEPKKKERTFGDSGLVFPKKCYVGIFPAKYQFCSREALITYLDGVETTDPYEVRDGVREKFIGCPIGVVGGYKEGEPGATYNVIWMNERTRMFYDPREKKVVEIIPLIVVI